MDDEVGAVQDRSFAGASAATARAYPPERRLTAAQLARYLDRRSYAVVSSARGDGRPHAAPSLFYRRGAEFWLPTVAGSVRERNVRAHPWLALTVTEGDDEAHVAVLIEAPPSWCPRSRRLRSSAPGPATGCGCGCCCARRRSSPTPNPAFPWTERSRLPAPHRSNGRRPPPQLPGAARFLLLSELTRPLIRRTEGSTLHR